MIQIKRMEPAHTQQIAELEKICFSDPWSQRSIASELENELALWLVCVDEENVLGYVGSQTVLGETDMMNIAVCPDARRKGIAGSLIRELVRQLREQGSHCLTLEVRASNAPAIALYEGLDFAPIGRRPNYYRNPKEDALILRKEWQI